MNRSLFVTGGAGFIGSNFILDWLDRENDAVVNYDKLTYAGNLRNLSSIENDPRYTFVRGDICHTERVSELLEAHRPRAIVHFAAESHVDRSILDPADFIATNVNGTFSLLLAAHAYWSGLTENDRAAFRFLHISTDEVYGTLGPHDAPFSETSPYAPNSPYAASKAASDHLVRAYHHTYGLPVLTTHCSNNYGPYQFPEKLIPLVIHNAIECRTLPIYGDGQQVRDWLYVTDHCEALRTALQRGRPGEVYNIGGWNEMTNLDVVRRICALLDEIHPREDGRAYSEQIAFVDDRRGHDRRYAIDASRIERELGWKPAESFESGLAKTVDWYLDNRPWLQDIVSGAYRAGIERKHA